MGLSAVVCTAMAVFVGVHRAYRHLRGACLLSERVAGCAAHPIPAHYHRAAHADLLPHQSHSVCQSSADAAVSNERGMTLCEGSFEWCGDATMPCVELAVGNSGAFGVKDINIVGSAANGGATIECGGTIFTNAFVYLTIDIPRTPQAATLANTPRFLPTTCRPSTAAPPTRAWTPS